MAKICCGYVWLFCWVAVATLQELNVWRWKGGELVTY